MARIFITGSADGLGQLAAKDLIAQGHQVVLHARNRERGKQALAKAPGAEDVLIADLSSMAETKDLAAKANASGVFDAVIHNAGVYRIPQNSVGAEGLPVLLAVNTLAPYILTCLMHRPKRLIYMSSGMHLQGKPNLDNLTAAALGKLTYSDTKLHDVILTMAIARKWTTVYANVVNPGWVPTKMGGAGAPDSLEAGYQTQAWLAVSNDPSATVTGRYFHHKRQTRYSPVADDPAVQEKFLAACEQITGVKTG
ncbi:MAG: SDR family NAD(P)-dependent oxidoreductase [Bacteroidota bacterium]|nr:SDR family NAD(P)-dependent oxidoreductase [Bacteroidota bacterium]MDP4215815.1 SDR family NAD(P)-dependent oxidoreductase [Bacteroidota bacterium]MDP4247403.1 SDR family NAD(P)-dependent oxidoreductase [Bacteroidota bacterium]